MDSLIEARNDAIEVNGPQLGDQTLTDNGSSWLYAVTAIFLLSFVCTTLPKHSLFLD